MASLLSPFTEGDDENGDASKNATGQNAKAKNVKEKEAALRTLMRDPRYWRERDPAYVARVENGFKRLFPEPR